MINRYVFLICFGGVFMSLDASEHGRPVQITMGNVPVNPPAPRSIIRIAAETTDDAIVTSSLITGGIGYLVGYGPLGAVSCCVLNGVSQLMCRSCAKARLERTER